MSARSEAGVTQADYEVSPAGLGDGSLNHIPGGPDSVRGMGVDDGLGVGGVGGPGALLLSQTMYLVYVTSLSLAGGVALALLVIFVRRREYSDARAAYSALSRSKA